MTSKGARFAAHVSRKLAGARKTLLESTSIEDGQNARKKTREAFAEFAPLSFYKLTIPSHCQSCQKDTVFQYVPATQARLGAGPAGASLVRQCQYHAKSSPYKHLLRPCYITCLCSS